MKHSSVTSLFKLHVVATVLSFWAELAHDHGRQPDNADTTDHCTDEEMRSGGIPTGGLRHLRILRRRERRGWALARIRATLRASHCTWAHLRRICGWTAEDSRPSRRS